MKTDDPVAELISRVAAQDRAAFRALDRWTSTKLTGVLVRILGTRSEAKDALQDVITHVWLRAGRFDATKGRGMTWMIAIARNHASDRLRSRPPEMQTVASVGDDVDPMEQPRDSAPTAEARMMAKGEAQLLLTPAKEKRSVFGWLAGALSAAAVVVVAVVMLQPAPMPPIIATLGEADAALRFEARFDGAAITVTRVAGAAAPQGQVQEVWIIAPDAAPVSLGTLAAESLTVAYPLAPAGWTLAVSLEPAGGSPIGAPTGPVLAAGTITDL